MRNRLHEKSGLRAGRLTVYIPETPATSVEGRCTMTHATTTDVLVVGAGPIGLETAALLQREGRRVLVIDRGAVGQTVTWFPRQMHFFSSNDRIAIAGVPIQTLDQQKATREEYLAYLRQVVRIHDIPIRTFEQVTAIARDDTGFVVTTARGGAVLDHRAGHVVLATGDMHAPRLLGIPGEERPHVSHYFEEPHRYFGRRLLVVGGKNSAVEAALRCFHAGAQVALSYRRHEFNASSVKYWLLPELEGRIRKGEIEGHLGTVPLAIDDRVVTLQGEGGVTFEVEADDVLLLTGYVADPTLLRRAGVAVEDPDHVPVYDPDTMETDVPGLYVAGTVTAGTQAMFTVFIENCHGHAERIAAHIAGRAAPAVDPRHDRPES
jgi:thioredoxin reductase (NADPH)